MNVKHKILFFTFLFIFFLTALPAYAYDWADDDDNYGAWDKRKELTINSSEVDVTGDYVVCLEINNDSDLNGADENDFIFTDGAAGAQLSYERVSWNDAADADLVVWIEVDSLSSSANRTIYFYFDNSGNSTDQQDVANTWDAEYVVVLHMEEADVTTTHVNSAGTDATETGDVDREETGQIGYAQDFANTGATIDLASAFTINGSDTVMFWFDFDGQSVYYNTFMGTVGTANDYIARWNSNTLIMWRGSSAQNSITATTIGSGWHFLATTEDGDDDWTLIHNAEAPDTWTNWTTQEIDIVDIGYGYNNTAMDFDGHIDEVIMLNLNKSEAWIDTVYNNQSDPDPATGAFWTIGDKEPAGEPENTDVLCRDSIDNDLDTLIDCEDPDCVGKTGNVGGDLCEANEGDGEPASNTCNDGFDNDADDDTDCADADCLNPDLGSCESTTEVTCNDGIDNDGDGYIDCCDSDCAAGCVSSDTTEVAFPESNQPTGLGQYMDWTGTATTDATVFVKDASKTNNANGYPEMYLYFETLSLTDAKYFEFMLIEEDDGDDVVSGRIYRDGANYKIRFVYYSADAFTALSTDDIFILADTYYYLMVKYDADEFDYDLCSCDGGVFVEIHDEDNAVTGTPRTPADLSTGFVSSNDCNTTNTFYYDGLYWDQAAARGPLGIVKQLLDPTPYHIITDAWTIQHANADDIVIYDGFNARGYHDDGGYEFSGWTETGSGSVLENNTAWADRIGPYALRFEGTGGQNPRLTHSLASALTHIKLSVWVGIDYAGDNSDTFIINVEDASDNVAFVMRVETTGDYFQFKEGNDYVITDFHYSEDEDYLIEIEWKYGASSNGIFEVKIDGNSLYSSSTRTSVASNVKDIDLGKYHIGTNAVHLFMDEIVLKNCASGDSWVGGSAITSILSDGSDTSLIKTNAAEVDSQNQEIDAVFEFEDPKEIGSIIAMQFWTKEKQYAALENKLGVHAYYEDDTYQKLFFYPDWPHYAPDTFRWRYVYWDTDPVEYLEYTHLDATDWDANIGPGDLIRGQGSGVTAYVKAHNITYSENGADGKLEILFRTESTVAGVGAGLEFAHDEHIKHIYGGEHTIAKLQGTTTRDALTWSSATNFLGLIRSTDRYADQETSGGGQISEVKLIVVSAGDNQVYMTDFLGTGGITSDQFKVTGRLNGPGYVKVRFGKTLVDVASNSNYTWTTAASSLTSVNDDYTWEVTIAHNDSVTDSSGSPHTIDFDSGDDNLRNSIIYLDILVKGENATDYYSMHRADDGTNYAYDDMKYEMYSTKAFPEATAKQDMKIVIVGDRHNSDRPDMWESIADESPAADLIIDLGDWVADVGDSQQGIWERYKRCMGLAGAPWSWREVFTNTPYAWTLSDHDHAANNTCKKGSAFWKNLNYDSLSDQIYYRQYITHDATSDYRILPAELNPDYTGNVANQVDLSGTATGGSATTLVDSAATWTDGSDIVFPGEVVHYIDNANRVYAWAVVSSVTDTTLSFDEALATKGRALAFDTGTNEPDNGDVISNGFGSTAIVAKKLAGSVGDARYAGLSGTWAGNDGAGYLYLNQVRGTWLITNIISNDTQSSEKVGEVATTLNATAFSNGKSYRITRGGFWYYMSFGDVCDISFWDTRFKRDGGGVPGGDYLDGTADGSAPKVDSTTTADGTDGDGFELDDSSGDFVNNEIVTGDGIVFDGLSPDKYAHVVLRDSSIKLTIDRNIATSGVAYYILEGGASDHGSNALNHAAGHVQRTAFQNFVATSTAPLKVIATEVEIVHNECGDSPDSFCDFDGACSGNWDNLQAGIGDPYTLIKTKLDVASTTGFDADNYVKGSTSGAVARIETVTDGDTLTFYTKCVGGCPSVSTDPYTYECIINGEFIYGETITEYTDINLTSAGATTTTAYPPSDAEFTASDSTKYVDYNRFWVASAMTQYLLSVSAPNMVYVVSDRHIQALDQALHTDDYYYSLAPGQAAYGLTAMRGSWFLDRDDPLDGYGTAPTEYGRVDQLTADDCGVVMGGYGVLFYDTSEKQLTMQVKDGTGTVLTTSVTYDGGILLELNLELTSIWIDEDFEETGGEEDWQTHLMMDWYADDYWLDRAVGM